MRRSGSPDQMGRSSASSPRARTQPRDGRSATCRPGADPHGGIIGSVYAVSVSVEDVPELMVDARREAARRVDEAIDSLHLAIRDIRNFIYGLRPEAVDGREVVAGIAALAQEVGDGGLVEVATT